jgi:hypothetical protein
VQGIAASKGFVACKAREMKPIVSIPKEIGTGYQAL